MRPEVMELLASAVANTAEPVRTTPRQIQRQVRLHQQAVLALVAAYRAGAPIKELRQQFGVGKYTIYQHLQRAGIKPNRRQTARDVASERRPTVGDRPKDSPQTVADAR